MHQFLESSNFKLEEKDLTTALYKQNQQAFLSFVNEVAVRMDRDANQNKQLKQCLDNYITVAKELEEEIQQIQSTDCDQQVEIEAQSEVDFENEIPQMEVQIQKCLSQIAEQKPLNSGVKIQNAELFKFINHQKDTYGRWLSNFENIAYDEGKGQQVNVVQLEPELFQNWQKQKYLGQPLDRNKNTIKYVQLRQFKIYNQFKDKKEELIQSIRKTLKENRIFQDLNRRWKHLEEKIGFIKMGEQRLNQLQAEINSIKYRFNCKVKFMKQLSMNIASMQAKEKEKIQNIDQLLGEYADESQITSSIISEQTNESSDENYRECPPKLLIQLQKPNNMVRIMLLGWFIVICIGIAHLFLF